MSASGPVRPPGSEGRGAVESSLAGVFALLGLIFAGVIVLGLFKLRLATGIRAAPPGLLIVAAAAGTAATFNPCGLPALPVFVGLGVRRYGLRHRVATSLAVSAGAVSTALVLALIVAVAGLTGGKAIAAQARWLQLVAGIFVIGVAVLHLTGQTGRVPFVGSLMGMGQRLWDIARAIPNPLGDYLFGVGFLAVGSS